MRDTLGGLVFVTFIAGKLTLAAFVAWSWWWLLLPIVPIIGVVMRHFAG